MNNPLYLLTPREKEVLQLLSTGLTYEKIAGRLEVSAETVKMHLKNIYQKLHVQNKIETLNIYSARYNAPIPRKGDFFIKTNVQFLLSEIYQVYSPFNFPFNPP